MSRSKHRRYLFKWLAAGGGIFFAFLRPAWADPVTNLSHTLVSSDTLSLQWTNQAGNAYQVFISSDPGFATVSSSGVTAADQNTTNYFNLRPGTSYSFLVKVSTDDDLNYLAISTYTRVFCPGFTGYQIFTTSASVSLASNNNLSSTTYRVSASTDGFASLAFSSSSFSPAAGAAPVLSILGLQPNSTYQIAVDALNFNNLPSSRTIAASTATLVQPPGTISFGAINPADITFQWNANGNPLTPPTSYQVLISTDVGFGVSSSSETFLTSVTSSTLIGNASYYFKVRSFGVGGDSSPYSSSLATFTLAGVFTNLVSTIQTVSSLSLSWLSANSSMTRVEISSSTNAFTFPISSPVLFSDNYVSTNAFFSGLRENTSYSFRLRALADNGLASGFSAVLTTRTASIPPEGISNLAFDGAFATADGEVRLAWTSPGGDQQTAGVNVASYIVNYSTFDITSSTSFVIPTISTFTQNWAPAAKGSIEARTVTGLNPGTTYFFSVRGMDAVGSIGNWDTSGGVNANRSYFAKDASLAAPSALQVTLHTSSSIALSWTAPSAPANVDDRDAYRIYWATWSFSTASDSSVVQTTSALHPLTGVSVTGLANQATYYFRVTAVDKGDQGSGLVSAAIESAFSASTEALTLDRLPPGAVSDLTALTGANEGDIFLSWTAPGDDGALRPLDPGSFYQIKYTSAGIITSANFASPPVPSFTKTLSTDTAAGSQQGTLISGLMSATTYWFAVKTVDDQGNSSVWFSSSEVSAVNILQSTVSQRDNVAPGLVTGLQLTQGYRRMTLAWVSPGDNNLTGNLTGYYTIKYGSQNIATLAEFNAAPSTVTLATSTVSGVSVSTMIVNLASNLTYYFAILAADDAGNISSFSAGEVKNNFPGNQSPGSFSLASPSDNSVALSTPLVLAWNPSSDADAALGDTVTYVVQYSTLSSFAFPAVSSATSGLVSSTGVTVSLQEDTTMYWRVWAVDQDTAVTISNTLSFRVNLVNTPPSAFSLTSPIQSTMVATLSPTFTWQASTDPDPGDGITYTFRISTSPTTLQGTSAAGIALASYTVVSPLAENTSYYWTALAVSTNPFTGTDTAFANSTFSFVTNSVNESPNAFSLLQPGDGFRSTSTLPTFSWHGSTDNDPGNTVTYTLTVQNAVNSVLFSTSIPNLTVTTHTLTIALPDDNAYTWSVTAVSLPDNLSTLAAPTSGRTIKVDQAKSLPAAVTLSTPTNSSIVTSTTPSLSWTAVTDPDNPNGHSSLDKVRYIVKIGLQSDYSDALGQQIFFSDFNGLDVRKPFVLQDQTTYYWQVAAAGYQDIGPLGSFVNVDTGSVTGCMTIAGANSNECFSVSAQYSFLVSLINTPPSAPSPALPANESVLGTNTPYFDWADSIETDPAQNISYILQISTLADFSFKTFASSGIASSSFTLTTPLLQNRLYHWRVLTQDAFGDGRPAGNPIPSQSTFTFRVPVLTTPKEPTGIGGSLAVDKSSFTLSWTAVSQNTSGASLSDLAGYGIYRQASAAGLGTGSPLASVSSNTVSYSDPVGGSEYYYTVRAFNASFISGDSSGTISINSAAAKSTSEQALFFIPNDPELQGKLVIMVPEGAKSIFSGSSNGLGEDLKLSMQKTTGAGLKDALFAFRVQMKTATSDREVTDRAFAVPIRISFPFAGYLAPASGAPGASPRSAPASGNDLAVFWFNGVEWLNFSGTINNSDNTISAQTRQVGQYAVKAVLRATSFEVFSITPKKVFTPNGDGCNDLITFQYQNPRGTSGISGKIFDIHGAFVTDMKTTSSIGGLTLDPLCPSPNLADDALIWDGKDSSGGYAKKGVYLYQIEAEDQVINGAIAVAR